MFNKFAVYIAAYVITSIDGAVWTITLDPLYDLSNLGYLDKNEKDSVWISCQESIMKASKIWKFKLTYYIPKSIVDSMSNAQDKNRFLRRQAHLIIFEFICGDTQGAIEKIYLLNITQ